MNNINKETILAIIDQNFINKLSNVQLAQFIITFDEILKINNSFQNIKKILIDINYQEEYFEELYLTLANKLVNKGVNEYLYEVGNLEVDYLEETINFIIRYSIRHTPQRGI